MISEQFEIVVVPFPFVDAPVSKPRPALVLSTAMFNRDNAHSVLAMITTAARTRWPNDHPIRDLAPTGLRAASTVRFKLFTLDNRIIRRRAGHLSTADAEACRARLQSMLGFSC